MKSIGIGPEHSQTEGEIPAEYLTNYENERIGLQNIPRWPNTIKPLKRESRKDLPKILEIVSPEEITRKLEQWVVGQKPALEKLAIVLSKIQSGIRPLGTGPLDSIFLAGPSGVGKTESVLAFVRALLPDGADLSERQVLNSITKIDGGEFQHSHEIAKLVGSPPGYLGHRETQGVLSPSRLDSKKIIVGNNLGTAIKMNVILIDEAEKAHQAFHDIMLGILDKGIVIMGDGKEADLSNSIIFFTSNLGNEEVERQRTAPGFIQQEADPQKEFSKSYKRMFRPEYQGRINTMIGFEHLDKHDLELIMQIQLRNVSRHFQSSGINLEINSITPSAMDLLIKRGTNLSEGARAIKKVVEKEIMEPLILAARTYKFSTGEVPTQIDLDIDKNNNFIFKTNAGQSRSAESSKAAAVD